VAGDQAGPLKDEITWEQLRLESGYPHDITEMTSVTKKIRRVGRFDWELAKKAVQVNGPTMIAINGLDYLNHKNQSCSNWNHLTDDAKTFASSLQSVLNVPIKLLGTGPALHEVFPRISDSATDGFTLSKLQLVK
jgi:adenylosuccinate synthase